MTPWERKDLPWIWGTLYLRRTCELALGPSLRTLGVL